MIDKIFNGLKNKLIKPKIKKLNEIGASFPPTKDIETKLVYLESIIGDNADSVIRRFVIGSETKVKAAIIYISSMTEKEIIKKDILEPLMHQSRQAYLNKDFNKGNAYEIIKKHSLSAGNISEELEMEKILISILKGKTALLIDGHKNTILIETKGFDSRPIEKPEVEPNIKGPKESFTENLEVNFSLIRRRIKHPDLKIETMEIGKYSNTDVSILYINDVANSKIVNEVKHRLKKIDSSCVLGTAHIESWIRDEPLSPFNTIQSTERVDRVAKSIIEGRIAIIADGISDVLILPVTFFMKLQAADDYNIENPMAITALRILRLLAINTSLLGPSIYIAITTFHQSMLPTQLLISVAAAREGVPYPAYFEALFMEIAFETLREAGVRLPMAIGTAISIVGALIIGDAAIRAGLASPAMVIIVAATAVSAFTIPDYNLSITIRILRFPIMIFAATLGLFGIMIALLLILIHVSSLRSFGVPYTSPLFPLNISDNKDIFVKIPYWANVKRPEIIRPENINRDNSHKPKPPRHE